MKNCKNGMIVSRVGPILAELNSGWCDQCSERTGSKFGAEIREHRCERKKMFFREVLDVLRISDI